MSGAVDYMGSLCTRTIYEYVSIQLLWCISCMFSHTNLNQTSSYQIYFKKAEKRLM